MTVNSLSSELSASTINTLHSEGRSNGAMGHLKGDKGNTSSGTTVHVARGTHQRQRPSPAGIAKKIAVTPTRLRCVQIRLNNHLPRSPPRDHYQLSIWRISKRAFGRGPLVKIICMKNNTASVSDSTFEVSLRGKTLYRRSRDFQCSVHFRHPCFCPAVLDMRRTSHSLKLSTWTPGSSGFGPGREFSLRAR